MELIFLSQRMTPAGRVAKKPEKHRQIASGIYALIPRAPFQVQLARAIKAWTRRQRDIASMTDQRDLLAREVDEELRREQLLKLWEQYGTYAVIVAVLIIVAVGGYKYSQYRSALAAEATGAEFVAATQGGGNPGEADKLLENIAAKGPIGYATLARLRLAAALRTNGKEADAASAYQAVADDGRVDGLLRDYARLQAAMLTLDTASWTDMQNRLNDLASDSNPWRYSARELLGLSAYKAGHQKEAREQFERLIGDQGTPPGIAERARIMMSMLTEADLAKAGGSNSHDTSRSEKAEDSKAAKATAPPGQKEK
jgi:hypothetical protein